MNVQLMAEEQDTIDRAYILISIARRCAIARAIHGAGQVPENLYYRLSSAERAFINSARHDLGLTEVRESPIPLELREFDAGLQRAHRDLGPDSPPAPSA
ncbi:hypothetical protein [Streptomyces sp. NPDC002156]